MRCFVLAAMSLSHVIFSLDVVVFFHTSPIYLSLLTCDNLTEYIFILQSYIWVSPLLPISIEVIFTETFLSG